MANILAHTNGDLSKTFNVTNKDYFESYKFIITPKKGNVILFEMIFMEVSSGAEKIIEEICKDLILKSGDKFQ